ncbi:TetR/AcrR family transcriptional regulator [Pseudomonas sp. GD03860]|uniref:TetR/AcrR family transcriptional regulator n=1 Tax=Pseudomonas TaxID=286 RepID=UPI002364292D|nr:MULTISPECIES: TetR/AcrR family transcriptional regulator [Pseudomonas]MDD2059094.1 TetR/AcrR family transcriptional regulator [Pseudomonas putida]MDH0640764.1 TetR/AcrR family transcriptional regulator [Pseudomonas sp. GD03860]
MAAKIIEVTAKLIAEEGMEAATIRNIAEQAKILPPQIYSHVGKIDELFDAVALYLWQTRPVPTDEPENPISGLYHAIDGLIVFGLTHPGLYLHISKPRDANVSGLWGIQVDELKSCIREVAKAGLLHVGEKQAVEFIHPFCVGMIFSCLHQTSRPTHVSWLVRQAVKPLLKKGAVRPLQGPDTLKSDPGRKAPNLASELKANLSEVTVLSMAESHLLREWLERIASS